MALAATLIFSIISLIVSTIVIYIITKLFGEKEGLGTAFLAALAGSLIYAIAYFVLGTGLLAAAAGGIGWLIALAGLYDMGILKSLVVAAIIWVVASFAGYFLPTAIGPL